MAADDAHAARELEAVPLGLPPGLEIEWLGVSGYRLTYQDVSIYIDPYVSRVPLRALLLRRTALPDPAPGAYKCGDVWGIRIEVAGITLYHQGSADLDDRELGDEPVDVFLAGVAGRSVTPRYWERILPKLDPRLVVPTHYDDFFAPLGGGLRFVRRVKLGEVPGEVAAVSRDARVAALPRVDV